MPKSKDKSGAGSPAPAGDVACAPKRKRLTTHRFRWNVRLIVGVPVILALVVLLLMRSALVGRVAGGAIESVTGLKLEFGPGGGAVIELDGRLAIRDFRLRLPGVTGEAAVVMSAKRATIDLDWTGVFTGELTPTAIRLQEPVFRISHRIEDNELNIGALASRSMPQGSKGGASMPRIDAIDGTIVIAEHSQATGASSDLRRLRVSGSFTPIDPTRPLYTVRFMEPGTTRELALLLDGRVNIETGATHLKLYNLTLSAWGPESIPNAYRELWRRLDVQGRIASATLDYDPSQGAQVEMTLDKVAMNVLVPAEGVGGNPDAMHDLGLREVSGTVGFAPTGLKAVLTGKLAGQAGESTVRLTTRGLGLDSALTCEVVAKQLGVTKETQFLPYMPERARQIFQMFSGPTGEVDASVVISRADPVNGQASAFTVSGGQVRLKNGTGAFTRFPYPFENVGGLFEFDDNKVRIVDIRGKGPTGAMLHADGIITPLTDEAMVDVNVHATGVPMDNHLMEAMPARRRKLLEEIFSQAEYFRLVSDGLVRVPGTAVPEGGPSAPEFGLGGPCDIRVNVHTPQGKDAPWFTTVDVEIPRAGMVVDSFPYPVRARNVKLHITDDDANLVQGEFEPLSGGTMKLSANVKYDEHAGATPDVRISVANLPVDRVLLHALPRDDEKRGVNPASAPAKDLSLGELMRRLNASGTVSCEAKITAATPSAGNARKDEAIAYLVDVDLAGARATPVLAAEAPSFTVEDLRGHLHVSDAGVRIEELQARLYRVHPEQVAAGFVGPSQCADLTLALQRVPESDASTDAGRLDAMVTVGAADLAEPIERFVGVFSPETGARLAELRTEYKPLGRLHAKVKLTRPPGKDRATGIDVTLDNASNIEFSALGGRMGVEWPEGVLEIAAPPDAPERLVFEKLRARLSLDGVSCGEVLVDGSVALDAKTGGVAPPADLTAQFAEWRFESPLIQPLLTRLTSAGTAETYRALRAEGVCDVNLRVQTEGDPTGPTPAVSVRAELSPRSIAFDWEGERVRCTEATGRATLRTLAGLGSHPVSGRFDQLRVTTPGWDAWADGRWSAGAGPTPSAGESPVQLDLKFGVNGRTLDAPMLALIPASAVRAINELGAQFGGPFGLKDGVVKTTLGDAASQTTFTGEVEFTDLAMSVGVPIDRASGRVAMSVRAGAPSASGLDTEFELKFSADTLRVLGIAVTDLRTTVMNGDASGQIRLPEFSAQCYAGRVTGHVGVDLGQSFAQAPVGKAAPARYEAEMVVAGVRLAPVLADAAAAGATDPGPVGPPNPFTDPDPSRGEIDARLSVSGISGDLASRKGGGAIRISNGDIIKLPVMLPLIQVSNFQIPGKDRLGYLHADFVVAGDTVVFDQVSLLSSSIAIVGEGTLKWPDLTLDMRFNSRSLSRVPLLSDVFEALRNEIVSTAVTGRLSSPQVSEEPLMGTRRLLDRLLNPSAYADLPKGALPSGDAIADRKRVQNASEATAVPNQP